MIGTSIRRLIATIAKSKKTTPLNAVLGYARMLNRVPFVAESGGEGKGATFSVTLPSSRAS